MKAPSARQHAIAQGWTTYQRTKPCKRGHMGTQYVTGGCYRCREEKRGVQGELAKSRTTAWRGRTLRALADGLLKVARLGGSAHKFSAIEVVRLVNRTGFCPITGRRLIRPGKKGAAANQIALRRLTSGRGWEPGNIEVVSMGGLVSTGEIGV